MSKRVLSKRVPWKAPSSGIARRPRRQEFPQGLHGFRCGRKQTSRSVRQQDPDLFRARSTGLEIARSHGELVGGARPIHAQLDGTPETWVGAGTGTLSVDTPSAAAFPARLPGSCSASPASPEKPSALRVPESARWGGPPPSPGMPRTWLMGRADGPSSACGWPHPRLSPAQLRLPPPVDALHQFRNSSPASLGKWKSGGLKGGTAQRMPASHPDEAQDESVPASRSTRRMQAAAEHGAVRKRIPRRPQSRVGTTPRERLAGPAGDRCRHLGSRVCGPWRGRSIASGYDPPSPPRRGHRSRTPVPRLMPFPAPRHAPTEFWLRLRFRPEFPPSSEGPDGLCSTQTVGVRTGCPGAAATAARRR